MSKSTKLCWSIIIIIFVLGCAGSYYLKRTTGVCLSLQLVRLWSGAVEGERNCVFSPRSILPPVYLSAVVGPFSAQQPLLQFQMTKLRMLRYKKFLRADLNSLAAAKFLLGHHSVLTLNYECAGLRDVMEINQARMQMQYLKRILTVKQPGIVMPQPVHTPLVFPTETANENFSWIAMSAKALPKSALMIGKDVYVCQGQLHNNNYSGQYSQGTCRLTYGGSAFSAPKFFILTTKEGNGQWVSSVDVSKMKTNPIYGGFENGQAMAICRVKIANDFHVGKVVNGNVCDLALQNQEVSFPQFEILYAS